MGSVPSARWLPPRATTLLAGFVALVGSATLGSCASPTFHMPSEHCALAPGGCGGVMADLQCRPDYPRYESSPWATDGVQGLAHDRSHWYITSTSRVWKVPLDEPLARATSAPSVAPFEGRYTHLGDADFHQGMLLVPLEGDRLGGPPAIGALRPDLTPIGVQVLHGIAHASWCAVHPRTGRLYTSNFHTDRIQVFRMEVTSDRFALVYERDLALRYSADTKRDGLRGVVSHIQGGVISETGKLYLATHHDETGIVVFDADSGAWIGHVPIAFRPRWSLLTHEEVEGLDLLDLDGGDVPAMTGQLHLLLRAEIPTRRYWLKHWGVGEVEQRDLL